MLFNALNKMLLKSIDRCIFEILRRLLFHKNGHIVTRKQIITKWVILEMELWKEMPV